MLLDRAIIVRWNNKNKKHYVEKGYLFTKINDEFIAKIIHLPHGTDKLIRLECDFCKKEIERKYRVYLNIKNRELIDKDACDDCAELKTKESVIKKYGVDNILKLEDVKIKIKKTTKEKYGSENISKTNYYRDKIKETSLKNWGVSHPSKCQLIQEKIKKTNLKKYGTACALLSNEVREKTAQSYYRYGTCKTSSQQKYVFDTLKANNYIVELNYPFSYCNLDVALFINDKKIDIEYDGFYWHKDSIKDRKRDEYLKSQGWLILRIKSRRDVPSWEQLIDAIDYLLISNKSFIQINLDDLDIKSESF